MGNDTQFSTDIREGIPIVHIVGDLDHYSLAEFRTLIADLIGAGNSRIILDMSHVDYMDSGGMSGLVFALKRLSDVGGRLRLSNCNMRVLRKLEIGGLTRISELITLCTTTDQALRECAEA